MRWLLWKDYRQNRLIVYTALVLLLAPHLLALFAECRARWFGLRAPPWQQHLTVSSIFSLCISQVAVALFGGNAIAGERADRSAEFLFSLPVTRRKLLASKLLLALSVTAVAWLINVPVLWHLAKYSGLGEQGRFEDLLTNTAITGLTFFCVAWCISTLTGSPAFAACGGLVTPLLVLGGIWYVHYLFELHIDDTTTELLWRRICLTLAPLGFALGTWHYLRRVEP